jgi:hypothetical protein
MATTQYQEFLSTNKVVRSSNNRDVEIVRRVGQRITKAVEVYYAEKIYPINWLVLTGNTTL